MYTHLFFISLYSMDGECKVDSLERYDRKQHRWSLEPRRLRRGCACTRLDGLSVQAFVILLALAGDCSDGRRGYVSRRYLIDRG